ncbi:hypothetical protein OR16_41531 [Cupriavidus basilensis OR16]|uniref:Lipoprotein n=1 Tax=Cupriavidus basilensis OR16 TaxID=1127483 RepID=H1SII2_9BURK|nr:hypothetical protein [Cupriavidus basilensis]EHP37674.1 hypothetical protein OR16_41531 [Cupriavidus basilensis OR16]
MNGRRVAIWQLLLSSVLVSACDAFTAEPSHGAHFRYPGTSEYITEGAPPGSKGFRMGIQRATLRDMLYEALTTGALLERMDALFQHQGPSFTSLRLAHPVSAGKDNFQVPDLIKAYHSVVLLEAGRDFTLHMEVLLRWLAVRYPSPAFEEMVSRHADEVKRAHFAVEKEVKDAEAAHQVERRRSPADPVALSKVLTRWHAARDAQARSLPMTVRELSRPNVWERIAKEAREQAWRLSLQAELQKSTNRLSSMKGRMELSYDADLDESVKTIEATALTPEAAMLAQAWADGLEGRNPLPPEVMTLFDLLILGQTPERP